MKTKELITVTPEMLWTIILNSYKESFRDLSNGVKETDIHELNRLKGLRDKMKSSGLYKTVNFKIVEENISKLEKELLKSENKLYISKLLTRLKSDYPEAIILPYKKLYEILDKYDLEMAPIDQYKLVIPGDIMEEMMNVDLSDKFYEKYYINKVRHLKNVMVTSDMDCTEVVNLISRIPFSFSDKRKDIIKYLRINENITEELANHVSISCDYRDLSENSWVIIAPSEEIKEQCTITTETYKEKERRERYKVQDPLVGKFCRHGFIIFSKWGKEANINELNDWIAKKWQ